MAWTWQTALFFVLIAGMLAVMTALAAWRPELPRRGILRIPTTRGDRLFVALLGGGRHPPALDRVRRRRPPGPPIVASVLFGVAMFRWA